MLVPKLDSTQPNTYKKKIIEKLRRVSLGPSVSSAVGQGQSGSKQLPNETLFSFFVWKRVNSNAKGIGVVKATGALQHSVLKSPRKWSKAEDI